jgi:hypothetical protein
MARPIFSRQSRCTRGRPPSAALRAGPPVPLQWTIRVDFALRDLSGKIAHPAGPQGRIQGGVGGDGNRLASVWLGQRAAAGNAHFQLAKVIEPRRYPARALTRFARRRGRTRLLPALAPHRNRCEERVPLVLSNGHGTLLSIMGYVHHTTMRSKLLNRESRLGQAGRGCPPPRSRFWAARYSTNERTAHPESLGGMSGRAVLSSLTTHPAAAALRTSARLTPLIRRAAFITHLISQFLAEGSNRHRILSPALSCLAR